MVVLDYTLAPPNLYLITNVLRFETPRDFPDDPRFGDDNVPDVPGAGALERFPHQV